MMQEPKHTSLLTFLLIAIVVHLVVGYLPLPTPHIPNFKKSSDEPLVVEKWDEEKKQIVRSSKLAETSKALNEKKARFGGEHKSRVEKEMRAALQGKFHQGRQRPEVETPGGERRALSLSDLLGMSSQPYALPDDIAIGDQTLLNTDPVIYASFTNRVSEEVYGSWVRRVKAAIKELKKNRIDLNADLYVTKLLVIFEKDGSVRAIQTMKTSGYTLIDNAARNAFFETEPFPNPPVKFSNDEDVLKFSYEFQLNYRTWFLNVEPYS